MKEKMRRNVLAGSCRQRKQCGQQMRRQLVLVEEVENSSQVVVAMLVVPGVGVVMTLTSQQT